VFTVKMAEEDFEALEDNQVLVQGMMANRCGVRSHRVMQSHNSM
jgi:hypothetical protein